MSTQPSPISIRALQTVGLSSTLILAGQTLTLSTFLVPRLLEAPLPVMLSQWNNMFQVGKRAGPPFALVSAVCYWVLAYLSHIPPSSLSSSSYSTLASSSGLGGKVWKYITAGILVIGIVPYTVLFLDGTNQKLLKRVKEMKEARGEVSESMEADERRESSHALVDQWGVLNLGRGMLVVASGVLGVWTALS